MQKKISSQEKRNSLGLRIGVALVAVVVVIAVTVFALNRENNGSYTSGLPLTIANEAGGIELTSETDIVDNNGFTADTIDSAELPNHTEPYRVEGREESDVPHVVIYTDPACPHCATFEQQNHQLIGEELNNGNITVEYRSVAFLNSQSQGYSSRAVNAFMCVADENPESYFDYLGLVTANGEPVPNDSLIDLASDNFGVDIEDCVNDSRYRAMASYNTNLASASGIEGTPTVLIDGDNWQDYGGSFPDMLDEYISMDFDSAETEELEDEEDAGTE